MRCAVGFADTDRWTRNYYLCISKCSEVKHQQLQQSPFWMWTTFQNVDDERARSRRKTRSLAHFNLKSPMRISFRIHFFSESRIFNTINNTTFKNQFFIIMMTVTLVMVMIKQPFAHPVPKRWFRSDFLFFFLSLFEKLTKRLLSIKNDWVYSKPLLGLSNVENCVSS